MMLAAGRLARLLLLFGGTSCPAAVLVRLIVRAPHRPCASSSVRLLLAAFSLIATLLLSPAAHAGTWNLSVSGFSYTHVSNGNSLGPTLTAPAPHTGSISVGQSYTLGNLNNGTASTSSATLNATVTGTWVADPSLASDPAPPTIVSISSSANSFGIVNHMHVGNGQANDGLGDAMDSSGYSSGTHYSLVTGGSFQKPLSLSASDTTPPDAGSQQASSYASVGSAGVTTYPVTINLIGQHSANQALTGQQITAILNIPPGFTDDATTYQWSVVTSANPPVASTDVFKTYTDSATSHPLVALSTYDLAALNLTFYDKKKETVLVKCNVTLIAPDGTTRIAVTAQSQPLAFLKPSLTSSGIANGFVYKDPLIANRWGLLPDPSTSYNEGMVWHDLMVDIPAPFPSGQCCLTQLVTPDRENYTDGVAADRVTDNKVLGLDNKFQVGPPPTGGPDPWTPPAAGNDSDSPAVYQSAAGNQHFNKITVADGFTTWIMYRPPAATYGGNSLNTVWVPLAKFSWNWACTLQWSNNAWNLTSATPLAASVKPSYAFSDTNDVPDWLVIHHNGN